MEGSSLNISFLIKKNPYHKDLKSFKEVIIYAVPLANKEGEISPHFGRASFIAFIALWDKNVSDDVIVNEEVIENPFLKLEKGKGIKVAELLVDKEIDIIYIRESFSGKGPEHVFSDAGVEVMETDSKELNQLKGIR